jgi:ABC-type phosphate transport system permease subunit
MSTLIQALEEFPTLIIGVVILGLFLVTIAGCMVFAIVELISELRSEIRANR